MENESVLWITGTVISASGYPRKNAEVRGVLFAGNREIGSAQSQSDYSGQYFLTIDPAEDVDLAGDVAGLRVVVSASSYGETIEFGTVEFAAPGAGEFEREIRLSGKAMKATCSESIPLLRAA